MLRAYGLHAREGWAGEVAGSPAILGRAAQLLDVTRARCITSAVICKFGGSPAFHGWHQDRLAMSNPPGAFARGC